MRVKKYKIMPYVRLSTVILFLFTLVPRVAFSIYEVFTGNGGPILPAADMEDISVEDLFPSLQFDLSSFSQDNIVDEYEQFQIQLGSARIENWFQTLDGFHSSLNSKLEQIEFYQRAIEMDLSRLRGVEYLTRAEGEQLGFNSGEVKNQLQEKYELLQGAKQLIQNQIQQIQIIYDTLVNLGLNEFSVDEATRNLLGRDIQEFMNELPNMSEDQLREAVNRWRDKLVDVQYAINSNTRMLQEIERTLISISGNDFPSHALRKFLSDVYSSVYNLNQDYLHYQDLLSKYLTRKDLLVRIQSDLNRLKEHMDNFKFLFQPGVEVSLCYLEKILRNLPLDKRQEIIPALRSDFNDMIRLYKNLTQYEDLLSHNQDWLDIHSKMSIQGGYGMEGGRNYIARFNNLLRGVDIQEGNLLVDYFLNPENSSPDFRLAQYVIFLNLTLSKVEQDPEALTELNVRDDFLNKLRDFMLDFNEMGKGIDFLRDKISPSLIETFSHSYYDVLEQTLGGIPYESVSILERVVSLIEYARDCQQKIGQLQDRLQQISDPVITGHGVRFDFEEIEEIEHQIQVLTAERDKALDYAETSLSRIGVNPDESSGWIDVLPENPSPQQPGAETTPISPQSTPDGPSSEPKVSTQAVDDKTARVTTQSTPPDNQKVSTQAAGDGDERRTLTTQSPSSQRDGDQKVSAQAAPSQQDGTGDTLSPQQPSSDDDQKVSVQTVGEGDDTRLTTQSAPQQQDGEPGNTTGNYQFDPGYEDPEQTGIDPDQEATQGDLIGDGGLLTAQETEEDGLLPTSPSRPDLNFPQGVGDEDDDNPGVPGVRKATTIFGNDHPIVGGDTPPSYDKTGDFPVPSENTINDYIIMIGDRLFNNDSPYTKYSEINKELAQFVFRISEQEIDTVPSDGYSEIGNDTRSNLEEGFFRKVEERINEKIETLKSLTNGEGAQRSPKLVPAEDSSFQNIEEVKILGLIGLGGEKGSYMIVRARSDVQQNNNPSTDDEGKDGEGTGAERNNQQNGKQVEEGVVLNSVENTNPDKAYIVSVQRAIEMIQSGENIERISQETGLSKKMVKALQEAWKNGTIMKNSSGAYIVVQVEVNGEKKIVIIPADTIVYITSSKPSEIVKEIIKKVFLKKSQVSDATVNRIFILLILLTIGCIAGGIVLAVIVTKREYRRWLEQIPLPKKPAGEETKPVYTKFVTGYHTYYRK